MNSDTERNLILALHHEVIGQATTVTTLRAKLATIEAANNAMVMAHAEQNAPLMALDRITEYIVERTRAEREALQEPNEWGRTLKGSAVAHTLYADLCNQLDKIRRDHGL